MNAIRHSMFLARRHLLHHRQRSALLIAALFIVGFLPIAVENLVQAGERALRARGAATPLVAGAPGAPIDLVLSALYFRSPPDRELRATEIETLVDGDLARVLPLVLGDRVLGVPLVGSDPGYLDFRNLECVAGRPHAAAGECVIGAAVAAREGVGVGDRITTEPREFFDLAGAYPLRMEVVGVLGESDGPDDDAVFTGLATAWIVRGLAHGHDDLEAADDAELVMGRTEDDAIIASAKVREFVEITDDNRSSFHFHAEPGELPVTAAIVIPVDAKAGTILLGRADVGRLPLQLVDAATIVDRLLVEVFRVRRILMGVLAVVGFATLLLVGVVVALSIRMRSLEIETMHLIGCGPGRVPLILATEVLLVLAIAATLAFIAGGLVVPMLSGVERLILG